MDTVTIIIIVVIVLLAIGLIAWLAAKARRRQKLKESFGPEYDRTVGRSDDRREAEADLLERQQRRDELHIQPLSDGARAKYAAAWDRVEARFLEDPDGAAREGDQVVAEVMRERGYPVSGREHTDVLSVDHPELVERYRKGMATAAEPRSASTEELRTALLDLRSTFRELVDGGRNDATRDQETRDGH